MTVETWVMGGAIASTYWCLRCEELSNKYAKNLEPCQGFMFGEIADLARQEEVELASVGGDR
ncbi:MAG TPA: hypothetical protein V6C63_07680 [Allocoleopsis sp.]